MSSKLDQEQIIKRVYEENTDRLRVDATVSASIGDVTIVDSDGNEMQVNPDGSINTNVTGTLNVNISAADGDNIAISDGTNTLDVNPDGSINAVVSGTVNAVGPLTNAELRASPIDVNTGLVQPLTDAELRASAVPVSVASLPLPTGAATAANQVTANTTLSSIDSKLTAPINVVGPITDAELRASPVSVTATDLDIRNLTFGSDKVDVSGSTVNVAGSVQLDEPVKVAGTIDGTPTGTEYGVVYNQRLQVLDAHDREDQYTYADFGTKNQRIIQIDYTSTTFTGITVRRVFNYVLDGNSYRRTDSIWSVV